MAGMKWNVLKFDYASKSYTGTFWDLADIDYFVDSSVGSDLNAGTYDAPFATLSKVKALGAGIWEDGLVIAANGFFTEDLSIDKAVQIIGAGGGYNGRMIFNSGGGTTFIKIPTNISGVKISNMQTLNYNDSIFVTSGTGSIDTYFNNCILSNITIARTNNGINGIYAYNSFFYDCIFTCGSTTSMYIYLYGNNNTLYSCSKVLANGRLTLAGDNNFINNDILIYSNTGNNNLLNSDARYFTDNSETVPALLLLDYLTNNFDFSKTVSIWDKTNAETITTNPLYRSGTFNILDNIYNHKGAGMEAVQYTANDTAFKSTVDGGDATYTNMNTDGYNLYRTDEGIDGEVESGIIDLGGLVTQGLGSTIFHSFAVSGGDITKRVQQTSTNTYREGFDYIIQYGLTSAQVATCPELLMEIGKTWSISGANASRVGNADPTFDPATATPVVARYIKYKIRLRNS